MVNHSDFPFLGYGVGLRPPHYSYILDNKPDIDWFEIISENYMDTDGRPRHMLEQVVEHYPIVMHGVSLSIGTIDPLNSEYLHKIKALADWVKPAWISDHLCWTGIAHKNTHDLLPVPYTEEALAHVIERIKRVQDILDRQLLLENPSTYLEFSSSSMSEWEFISRMSEGADCKLLLDANNIYVSCYNHHWDAKTYIDALPLDRVEQIHLAGHLNNGTHIIDTHDSSVIDEVWNLYAYILNKAQKPISTMVEWDDNIPDFPILQAEVNKARDWASVKPQNIILPNFSPYRKNEQQNAPYNELLGNMQEVILDGDIAAAKPDEWIPAKPNLSAAQQIGIYVSGYRYRLFDVVYDDFPTLRHYLGNDKFRNIVNEYIEATPATNFNISRYVNKFAEFVRVQADEFAYELAVMETYISQLHDEPETIALTHDNLNEYLPNITPETFMAANLYGRKALKLLPFAWGVNEYFTAVKDGDEPLEPTKRASYLAVYRHENTMWRLDLEEQEYMLLSSLFSGVKIGEAMAALTIDSADDISAKISEWFAKWINNGLLAVPE